MTIIRSMLDDDFYKFTMGQAVFLRYPEARVEYRFTNRGDQRFNGAFLSALKEELAAMELLRATQQEIEFLRSTGYFVEPYLSFLEAYRYDAREVLVRLTADGDLVVRIGGLWARTIYWEVKLMAVISELYFSLVDTDWSMDGQLEQAREKLAILRDGMAPFADFGTRRRRSFATQKLVVERFANESDKGVFLGTSNVYLAMRNALKPIGTTAHEWFQGISALESLNHANREALRIWSEIYRGTGIPLIGLTDTFTTQAFLRDFSPALAAEYAGVRHDSGCPFAFADRIVEFYQGIGIPAADKSITFSDGLSARKAVEIRAYVGNRIKAVFGIGTHFTNDFAASPALNMVIKLFAVNGTPVVKLSDSPTKASGDPDAVRVARWVHAGRSLDRRDAA
jgi:nicotinate phosphoribosyltransferase